MRIDSIGFAKIIIILLCSFSLLFTPLEAIAKTEQQNYLTLEILEEQIGNSIQKDGHSTIDLRNYIIDLSNPERELTRQFYQQINHIISRNTNPIVIDLSNSIVRGNLSLSQLGISTFVDEGALSSLLNPLEQNKIRQYYPVANDVPQHTEINVLRGSLYFNGTMFTGEIDGSNSLFLQSFEATAANFQELANFDHSVFSQDVNFSDSIFEQSVNFGKTHFFAKAKFNGSDFKGFADFSNSQFEEVLKFDKSLFEEIGDFSHSVFVQPIKFSRTMFRDRLNFAKAKFLDSLVLVDSTLEGTTILRDIYVKSLVNLQDTHILNKIDLSNAFFALNSRIDVSRLAFDSTEAKITGQPGIIGKLIKVDRLSGNEIVLRNLIRNFRSLEQIADANFIEYQQQRLRERQIGDRLLETQSNMFTWTLGKK